MNYNREMKNEFECKVSSMECLAEFVQQVHLDSIVERVVEDDGGARVLGILSRFLSRELIFCLFEPLGQLSAILVLRLGVFVFL